jgi:hypothetical protein
MILVIITLGIIFAIIYSIIIDYRLNKRIKEYRLICKKLVDTLDELIDYFDNEKPERPIGVIREEGKRNTK